MYKTHPPPHTQQEKWTSFDTNDSITPKMDQYLVSPRCASHLNIV